MWDINKSAPWLFCLWHGFEQEINNRAEDHRSRPSDHPKSVTSEQRHQGHNYRRSYDIGQSHTASGDPKGSVQVRPTAAQFPSR